MTKTTTYRRRPKSDTWHWIPACSQWPKAKFLGYSGRASRPGSGELCQECLSKQRKVTGSPRRHGG